jgi:hypothetical protein
LQPRLLRIYFFIVWRHQNGKEQSTKKTGNQEKTSKEEKIIM